MTAMLTLSPSHIRRIRVRKLFGLYLWCFFAGLALVVSAQSQTPGQNPNTNAPVVIPRDTQLQLQPNVQPQPSRDLWDRWGIEKVSKDDDWTRHFRVGAMVGFNISANFNSKGTFINPNPRNGIFDDGYVRSDGKGDTTGYWGYNWGNNNATLNNPSQYDAVNQTLSMHAISSYTPTSSSAEQSGVFPGFEMAYGGNLWTWKRTRIGWEFGFGLLPISITDNHSMTVSITNSTYLFRIPDGVTIDDAPYYGTLNGQGEPRIFLNQSSVTNQYGGTETITGSRTLDVMLYTFRLGPTLYWDLNEDLGLTVGAGPALGLMSGSLKYNETIGTTSYPPGRIDATDVIYGGYVNAMLTYHVEENGDLYLGVQYMSLGNARISGGGREARLNLGGQVYITAGISWPF